MEEIKKKRGREKRGEVKKKIRKKLGREKRGEVKKKKSKLNKKREK